MSVQIDISERQLKLVVLKLAVAITGGLLIAAFALSLLLQSEKPFAQVPIDALLIAVAVSILANGVLAVLKIIDWFEERKSKREVTNG